MSIFGKARTDQGSARRVRARHLLPLALLALVPILLAPAGSAKPTPTTKFEICVQNATSGTPAPACSGTTGSTFLGNTLATLEVSVENDSASTVNIESAYVNVPNQLKVKSASPTSNITISGQQVRIHGVRVQPGRSFMATFQAYVACGGQFDWPAQQAFTGDNGSGTAFTYQAGSSTGVSTSITTACHLGFVAQPTDTQNAMKIAAGGASQGGPITVGLFSGASGDTPLGSCPMGYTTCTVTVSQTPGDGTLTNGADPLSQQLTGAGPVATYSNLSINVASRPEQFRLTASADGSFAPPVNSNSFLIADDVSSVSCPGGSCQLNNKKLSGSSLVDSFADLTGASGFTFMTLSPYTLGDRVPAGCANRISAGVAGFAESDGRAPGSPLTIRYYVDKDQLKARYGKNVGEQFIPICAGGRPVDPTTHEAIDCTQLDAVGGSSHGWVAQKLTNKGTFAGVEQNAICDADGYYWGILSSYQDKIPTGNPVVANWGGQNINGKNYRFFDIFIPGNWDWRSGP